MKRTKGLLFEVTPYKGYLIIHSPDVVQIWNSRKCIWNGTYIDSAKAYIDELESRRITKPDLQALLEKHFYHDRSKSSIDGGVQIYLYKGNYCVRVIKGVYRLELMNEFTEHGYQYTLVSVIDSAYHLKELLRLITLQSGQNIRLEE